METCDWCHREIPEWDVTYRDHFVFHSECLCLYRFYLQGLKEARNGGDPMKNRKVPLRVNRSP